MPTVQVQQLHCATMRPNDLNKYIQKSCRCQNLPSVTARVSRLTLQDGNIMFSSKGFSSIINPARGLPLPSKTSKGSSLPYLTPKGSAKPVSTSRVSKNDTSERNVSNSRSPTPPHQRFVSPTRISNRSVSVSRNPKASSVLNNNYTNTRKPVNGSVITKKLANISISGRNFDYDHFSVQKEDSPKHSSSSNTNYHKHTKTSQYVNTHVENKSEVKTDQTSCSSIQRLHPGWRRVPWKPHFGWTNAHQELCKLLRQENKKGSVESIYYSSEEEHAAASVTWRTLHKELPFLGGPSVSSVSEVLEVIRKMSVSRAPWLYMGRASRWNRKTASALSEYDADDED